MKLPKSPQKCKNCGSIIETPLNDSHMMGISKFCSVNCYSSYNRIKTKAKSFKVVEEQVTISKERFKKLDTEAPQNIPFKGKKLDRIILDRSEQYLDFIRQFACISCGKKEVHAAHLDTGGTGIKGSDFSTVSLCDECHLNGNESLHKLGEKKFEEVHKINLRQHQANFLIQFIRILLQSE